MFKAEQNWFAINSLIAAVKQAQREADGIPEGEEIHLAGLYSFEVQQKLTSTADIACRSAQASSLSNLNNQRIGL